MDRFIGTYIDLQHSQNICNKITVYDDIYEPDNLQIIYDYDAPELAIYYDVCRTKVYKLYPDKTKNEYPCNCKLAVFLNTMMNNDNSTICKIHYNNDTYLNVPQMIENILIKWNMLERFFLDQQQNTLHISQQSGCVDYKRNNLISLYIIR